TSIIGGGCVWLWQRVRNASGLRRKEAFFGLEPRGTCLIVMNNKFGAEGATHHDDVQAMIAVATLASGIGSSVVIESCNDLHGINGDRTEFCIGGPTGGSNPRTGAHLAAHLPGVAVLPADPGRRDPPVIVAGERQFPWKRGEEDYALVAKFTPPGSSRPVIVICGQTALSNRAAVYFLQRDYASLAKSLVSIDRFAVVVRVASAGTYGHQAVGLLADVSAAAFTPRLPREAQAAVPPLT
ncbi:MAG: hypothetical protein ABJB47_00385, partial [Actinomycetota bacterium]